MVDEVLPVDAHQTRDGQPSPGDGDDVEIWVALSEAVQATGVADKTLRRWLSKGEVQGVRLTTNSVSNGQFYCQR